MPEQSGPSAAIAPPVAAQSAIDLVRAGPDQSAAIKASVVGYAIPAAKPTQDPRAEQHFDVRCPGGEAVRRHRHHHADDEQELAPVPVADRAEVQHRRGEPERVADRDQIELRLRRVEFPPDLGERDVGDGQAQVGDRCDCDQRTEDEACSLGARRTLVECASHGLARS
jgi:hypothetical protein